MKKEREPQRTGAPTWIGKGPKGANFDSRGLGLGALAGAVPVDLPHERH